MSGLESIQLRTCRSVNRVSSSLPPVGIGSPISSRSCVICSGVAAMSVVLRLVVVLVVVVARGLLGLGLVGLLERRADLADLLQALDVHPALLGDLDELRGLHPRVVGGVDLHVVGVTDRALGVDLHTRLAQRLLRPPARVVGDLLALGVLEDDVVRARAHVCSRFLEQGGAAPKDYPAPSSPRRGQREMSYAAGTV